MTVSPRYAIYYAPRPSGALWRFGSRMIGYDAFDGSSPSVLVPDGVDAEHWRELTREPRRYGFHATLKAPFRLASDRNEAELLAMLSNFAAGRHAVPIGSPEIRTLGSFIALVPVDPPEQLGALAFDVVNAFEPFRAPLSDTDRARRLESPLTRRQIENLDRWGYPYVGPDFRFHMTLTGPIHADVRDSVRCSLSALHRDHAGAEPVTVDRICIFKQESRSERFRIIGDADLRR